LPALATTGATLGVSPSEVGLTMSTFMLSPAAAPGVYGPVSDRLGRKPVVAFDIALFVVASLACALAQSLPELLICRFVQGIAAASTAMTFAIVRDLFGETTARTKIANVVVAINVVTVIAPTGNSGAASRWRLKRSPTRTGCDRNGESSRDRRYRSSGQGQPSSHLPADARSGRGG
jgi:MFS transporter, DHA1 family, multidrug resistance protein